MTDTLVSKSRGQYQISDIFPLRNYSQNSSGGQSTFLMNDYLMFTGKLHLTQTFDGKTVRILPIRYYAGRTPRFTDNQFL